jgi:surface protein
MNLEKNHKNNIIYLYVMSSETKEDVECQFRSIYYPRYDFDDEDDYNDMIPNFNHNDSLNCNDNYYVNDEYITDENIRQFVRDYIYGYYDYLPEFLIVESTSDAIPIGQWDVSRVTNMSFLFAGITRIYNVMDDKWEEFDENLNDWDVSNVKNMTGMFYYCKFFKSPLNKWNVSNVTNMTYMFTYCKSFNSDINSWIVSNVKNMEYMFYNCLKFNKPLNNWNVTKCDNFKFMFNDNYGSDMEFNQNLSSWLIKDIPNIDNGMFSLRMSRYVEGLPKKIDLKEMIEQEAREHFTKINYLNLITEQTQGRAFEIHNEFKTLSQTKINYLYDLLSHEVGLPSDTYKLENIKNHIVSKLTNFINSEENVDLDKDVYTSAINVIERRLDFSNKLNLIPLYGYLIDFVFKQPYIFKMNYVQLYLKDCMGSYSVTDSPLTLPFNMSMISCVTGISERILLALGKTLEIICSAKDETICPKMYEELYKNVFKSLNMNELVMEWNEKYLDNEKFKENHDIRKDDPNSKKKMSRSLINYLMKKYSEAGELTRKNYNKIIDEVIMYMNDGVFDRLQFGGKKRKNKRQTKKLNKKLNKKYNKKSNKKFNKKFNKKSKKYY